MGRVVGVDFGTVRIGLAISDESQILARILKTIPAEKKLEESCIKLLSELSAFKIDAIVVGLPLHMSGKMGSLADDVKSFVEILKSKVDYPVVLWDERLTTVQAERALREANISRKKRSKVIDSVTAVILLQSYLDYKGFTSV